MKKLAVISVVLLFVMGIGQIQASTKIDVTKKDKKNERKELRKLDINYISNMSLEKLKTDLGNIDMSEVKWKRVLDYSKAEYIKDGQKKEAFYDEDGQLVGTSSAMTFTDLPDKAQNDIQKRYGDYTVEQVIDFVNNSTNGTPLVLCGYELNNKDNYFVQMTNENKKIILYVDFKGNVSFFKHL